MDVLMERCCGLDVHKKSITACIITPNHQPPTTNHQPPTTNHQPPTSRRQAAPRNHWKKLSVK
ncbi:hypothetical protein E2980_13825 [Cohnella luojiensis]|uniref:IS110 family transposase n=1 Tax=Cohnella luojiensis TaxID=652876 RepID=A0A4Y8LWJ8_9BACL|nr:hypothetical protein E2980_13825 [Cohnella luojiensis]